MRMRAFLRDSRGTRQFGIKMSICRAQWMDDLIGIIMRDDGHGFLPAIRVPEIVVRNRPELVRKLLPWARLAIFGLLITSATCFLAAGGAGLVITSAICFLATGGLVITSGICFMATAGFSFAITWGGVSFVITSGVSLVIT